MTRHAKDQTVWGVLRTYLTTGSFPSALISYQDCILSTSRRVNSSFFKNSRDSLVFLDDRVERRSVSMLIYDRSFGFTRLCETMYVFTKALISGSV
jgi:hypothetical protein